MNMKVAFTIVVVAAAAFSAAQPARLAWTRTSNYVGIAIDTARDGIVSSAGNFVVVGASKTAGQPPKGNITVFNRKTAALTFVEIVPAGGGGLELHRILEDEGIFYVFGTYRPTGSPNDKIYVGKYSPALALIASASFDANTYGGSEKPTDIAIDAANNIYITGVAQKNTIYQAFLAKCTPTLASFALNFAKIDFNSYNEPQVALNGATSILMGVVSNTGATLRSYHPAGATQWNTAASSLTTTLLKVALEKTIISGSVFLAVSGTDQIFPGTYASAGSVLRINAITGAIQTQYNLTPQSGQGTLQVADIMTTSLSSRRVNALFNRNGQSQLVSLNENGAFQSSWADTISASVPSLVSATNWGDIVMALGRSNTTESVKGLAINNASRFSMNTPTYNLLLPFIEQDNLFHLPSGDMLTIRTDNDKMQVSSFQQAPAAVSDSYTARTGVTFRPLTPVFTNDRFYEGGALSVVIAPLHGTVTLGSNGFFAYKSAPGYTGPDSFRYQITKSGLTPSQATINITVVP